MRYYRGERIESEVQRLLVEPWPLRKSIFWPRSKECESQSLFNAEEVANRCANTDWLRMLQKPSFANYLGSICAQAAQAAQSSNSIEADDSVLGIADEQERKPKSQLMRKAAKTVIAKQTGKSPAVGS